MAAVGHGGWAEPPRPLTSIEIDEMVAAYRTGSTTVDLAEQFGIHRATVRHHLKSRGIESRHAWPAGQMQQAIEWYSDGVSLQEIARRVGRAERTVQRHLRAAGVAIRPPGPVPKQRLVGEDALR